MRKFPVLLMVLAICLAGSVFGQPIDVPLDVGGIVQSAFVYSITSIHDPVITSSTPQTATSAGPPATPLAIVENSKHNYLNSNDTNVDRGTPESEVWMPVAPATPSCSCSSDNVLAILRNDESNSAGHHRRLLLRI